MTKTTIAKLATLHNAVSEKATLNRYNYGRIRNLLGKENVPCWQTLKKNGLVVLVGQTVLCEEGYEEEFVVVNSYRVNF